MRLDREKDRGNIADSTEIVNDGELVGYAEVDYGPWSIEYERNITIHGEERVKIDGPFIDNTDRREVTVGLWSDITDAIGTWDYVELCEVDE